MQVLGDDDEDNFNPYAAAIKPPIPRQRGTPCRVAEVAGLLGKIMQQVPDSAFEQPQEKAGSGEREAGDDGSPRPPSPVSRPPR